MPVEPASMSTKLPTQMPGEVIMTDRPCIKCGYNLRGLQAGGACPECGTAITNAKKSVRYSDSLVDAPIGYIRLMAVGLGLQAGTILGITLLLILSRFHNNGVPLIHPLVQGVATLGAMVAWFAAAWIVTLRRPKTERVLADEILDNDLIRKLTRGSQSLALVATLVGWLGVATGFTIIKALAGLLMIGALFGLVPLGIYLSAFADWASETGEGARLRTATWCIAVCGTLEIVFLLVLKLNPPFALLLTFGVVMGGMVVVGGVLMFAFSVCMLAKASMWAIHNAVQAREREIRIANKRHRQAMRDAARAQAAAEALAADAPPPPESYRDDPSVIPFDEGDIPLAGDEPRVQRSAHEHHIDRKLDALRREGGAGGVPDADGGDDSEIYDLAPED